MAKDYVFENNRFRLASDDRIVPTITKRKTLLRSTHDLKGHPSIDDIANTIEEDYFWETL